MVSPMLSYNVVNGTIARKYREEEKDIKLDELCRQDVTVEPRTGADQPHFATISTHLPVHRDPT